MSSRWVSPTLTVALLLLAGVAHGQSVWVIDDGEKVKRGQLDTPWERGEQNPIWQPDGPIRIAALRNEVVAFQVVVEAAGQQLDGVTVELPRLEGPGGRRIENGADANDPSRFVGRRIERFVAHYYNVERASGGPWGSLGWNNGSGPAPGEFTGWVPDALIPVEWAPNWSPYPMRVPARQNRVVWIDVTIPRGQRAGLYRGTVTVRAGVRELASIPVELAVGDAVLPEWPARTMLYYNIGQIRNRMGNGAAEATERHLVQLFHRHRISALHNATSVNEARTRLSALDGSLFTPANGYEGPAQGVGDDLLCLGVYGAFGAPDNGDLRHVEGIADLLAAEGLLDATDVFVYVTDENCASPWGRQWMNLRAGSNNPNVDQVRIGWTCSEPALEQPVDLPMKIASHYDSPERDRARDAGREVWIYNGVQPFSGSFMTDIHAISPRVNGWIAARHDIGRWFYWNSVYWNDWNPGGWGAFDPFTESETFHNRFDEFANGDGMLVYPGRQTGEFSNRSLGVDAVIASIRLKNWRRGIQDAGYFQLARQTAPGRAVEIVDDLLGRTLSEARGNNPPNWSVRGAPWYAARQALRDLVVEDVEPPPPADAEIPRLGASAIDGALADFEGAPEVVVRAGPGEAHFFLGWTARGLHIGVQVSDADLRAPERGRDSVNLWRSDAIEILIDARHDRTPAPNGDDRQVVLTVAGDLFDARRAGAGADASLDLGVEFVVEADGSIDDGPGDTGWVAELMIPWAGLEVDPIDGLRFGLDLALDNAGAEEGAYATADWAELDSYANPSGWRIAQLSDEVVGGEGGMGGEPGMGGEGGEPGMGGEGGEPGMGGEGGEPGMGGEGGEPGMGGEGGEPGMGGEGGEPGMGGEGGEPGMGGMPGMGGEGGAAGSGGQGGAAGSAGEGGSAGDGAEPGDGGEGGEGGGPGAGGGEGGAGGEGPPSDGRDAGPPIGGDADPLVRANSAEFSGGCSQVPGAPPALLLLLALALFRSGRRSRS